jgi:hypothetical protein
MSHHSDSPLTAHNVIQHGPGLTVYYGLSGPMNIRTCALGLWLLGSFYFPAFAGQPQSSGDFQLSLIRDSGKSGQCRVNLVTYRGSGSASLGCNYPGTDGCGRLIPPLTAREELSSAEVTRLTGLVQRSALYEGGHVGGVWRETPNETAQERKSRPWRLGPH